MRTLSSLSSRPFYLLLYIFFYFSFNKALSAQEVSLLRFLSRSMVCSSLAFCNTTFSYISQKNKKHWSLVTNTGFVFVVHALSTVELHFLIIFGWILGCKALVTQIIICSIERWNYSVLISCVGCWRKRPRPDLWCYSHIFLEGMRKAGL